MLNTGIVKRNSNIEMLRIVAMFLVLVVHANFFALGSPTHEEAIQKVFPTLGRFFFQSLSIGCVDLFVLISGWFGIRPNIRGFLSFVFQCVFFLCGIYCVFLVVGYETFSINGVLECLAMTKHNWFIKSYILLYILAPILNTYVEHSSEKELRNLLLMFYAFQTIYGWITASAIFFVGGFSTISFVGLYLLARYVRLYAGSWATMSWIKDLVVFLIIVCMLAVFAYVVCRIDIYGLYPPIRARIYSYINPFVIISVLFLLLCFSKLKIQSSFINNVAASCFAVFLLHQHASIVPLFKETIRTIYETSSGVVCLFILFIYLSLLFVFSVIVDRIRMFCWTFICRKWL